MFGERLIDGGDVRLGGIFVFGKRTAAHQFGADRCEIVRADMALRHFFMLAMPGTAENAEPGGVSPTVDGNVAGKSDGFYAGNGRKFRVKLARKDELIFVFRIGLQRSGELERG